MEGIQHELSTLSIGLDKAMDITSNTRDQVITSTAAVRIDIKKGSKDLHHSYRVDIREGGTTPRIGI
jgi:hypothetical protein